MPANHPAATATMQIGEVAKRTFLTIDAIRFYERRRLLPQGGPQYGAIPFVHRKRRNYPIPNSVHN